MCGGGWSVGLRRPQGDAFRPERKPSPQFSAATRPGWLGTWLFGTPSLAVFQPVTFPVHFQDVDVMGEPVQQVWFAKSPSPLLSRSGNVS
jgi:hypothetical protein